MQRKLSLVLATLTLASMAWAAPAYRSYAGKYPYDIAKRDKTLEHKLKALLGRSYGLYAQNSAVQVPCALRDGFLVVQGCRAHECNSDYSFALINVSNGALSVGIVSDADSKQKRVRSWSEHKRPVPALFRRLSAGEQVQ